jgi:hypothetical protein
LGSGVKNKGQARRSRYIPILGHYGLALMALLMLGVGFIGFRRFV